VKKTLLPIACIALISCGGSSDSSGDASDGGADGGSHPGGLFNSLVQELAVIGSEVYLSGPFEDVGGDDSLDYFVKWDGEAFVAPGAGAPPNVQRLMVHDGTLYTCGGPQIAPTNHEHFISTFDGSSWADIAAFESTDDQVVDCVISPSGEVHMAGSFTFDGGQPHEGVVKWDGSELLAVGGEVTEVGQVRIADDGTVYLVRMGANVDPGDLHRLNGDVWEPVPALPGGMTFVNHPWINTVGNNLHAAALVEDASHDGQDTDFYVWNGSTWQSQTGDQSFEFGFPHPTYRAVNGEYYASRYGMWAKWSGDGWVEVTPTMTFRNTEDAWSAQVDYGLAIGVSGSEVYVAGYYP